MDTKVGAEDFWRSVTASNSLEDGTIPAVPRSAHDDLLIVTVLRRRACTALIRSDSHQLAGWR